MSGLTQDVHVVPYGAEGGLVAYPVGANQQLYIGEVALVSGGGAVTKGYLKNAASPGSTDIVVGMIGEPAGGTAVQTGPGVLGGTTDGAVWIDVQTGCFFVQGGSGGDALSAASNGQTVYLGPENASGPVADATGAGTRPVLGVQLPQDPGIAGGFAPGAGYWPIKLNNPGSATP